MLLRGNTTPTPPPLRPHHLYYYYYYYYYSTDFITATPPPLHLASSPEPFGRCVAARHETERRERPRGITKIKVDTGDVAAA